MLCFSISRSASASPRRPDVNTGIAAGAAHRAASESPVRFPLIPATHSEPFRLTPSSVKEYVSEFNGRII